jgi:predicted nucleic acid-binding Zn ribbon protein
MGISMANCKYCPICSGELRRTWHGKHDMVCTECGKYFTWFQLLKKPVTKCLNCGNEIDPKRQFCCVSCYCEYLRRQK